MAEMTGNDMELPCPNCSSPLQLSFYEGIQVHLCAACRGVMLDKQRLQEIARKRDTVIPRNLPPPRRRAEEAPANCPRCRVPMGKGKYGKLRVTTFDMCEQCGALWLDQGELESIQLDFEMVSDNRARSQAVAANSGPPPDIGERASARAASMTAADVSPSQEFGGRVSTRASSAESFQCPKCSHPQPRGETCTRCGIVFAKYQALQQERSAQAEQYAEATRRMDECFKQIRGFNIQQIYHLTEAIIGFERANRYTAQPIGANVGTWRIEETNRSGLSILGRNLFGSLYTFTMQVLDETRKAILTFERRARFYFYHLDVFDENGREIGSARRRFSWFNRVVTVHDEDERELVRITGPYFKPWTFFLRRGEVDAGIIEKQWSGGLKELYTDADRFSMRFESNLDARMRRLALGAMMLIDSLYFEGRKPFLRHFFDAPGVQVMLVAGLLAYLVGTAILTLPATGAGTAAPPAAAARNADASTPMPGGR